MTGIMDRIPLTRKLSGYLFVLIAVSTLFLIVFFAFQFQRFRITAQSQAKTNVSAAQAQLISLFHLQEAKANQLAADHSLTSFVTSDHTKISTVYKDAAEASLRQMLLIQEYASSSKLLIANKNRTVQSYDMLSMTLEEALSSDWISSDISNAANSQAVFWGVGKLNGSVSKYVVCYKGIYSSIAPYELEGIIIIGTPIAQIETILNRSSDEIELVFTQPDYSAVSRTNRFGYEVSELSDILKDNEVLWKIYHGKLTLFVESELNPAIPSSQIDRWKIIGISNAISYSFFVLTAFWFVVLSAVFAVLTVLMRAINKNIAFRTNVILEHIGSIASEDYGINRELGGADEFYLINEELNGLSVRLQRLIREDMMSQIEKQRMQLEIKEQEIATLHNQINPHYIVNTLEVIRMKLLISGETESSEMVQCLAESLRTYAWSPRSTITIKEELDFLERYFALHNFRFIQKVTYHFEVEDDVKQCSIPRFMIQPLLENAMKHGFKNKIENPHIEISCFRDGEYLIISIADNGLGIEEQKLQKIQQALGATPSEKSETPGSIGLMNVHRRLRLLYGNDCGLKIKSKVGYGTEIEIILKDGAEENGQKCTDY